MSRKTVAGLASVRLLCLTFGLSSAAYYVALRAQKHGRPSPSPGKVLRLPARPRYASAEAVLAAIKEVLARVGSEAWGVRKVWATMRQEGLRVSTKRVWAIMHAHGLVLARDRDPGEPLRGHVAVPEPNRRFATDMTTTWTKRDGVVAIVPCIDCGCRSVLGLAVTKDQHSPAVLAPVREALVAAFGCPENVPDGVDFRTDHGPQYTGADCEALVTEWHLDHTYAPVGRPTGNAVAERVIRTLKEEVVWLRDWDNIDELTAALEAWRVRYNEKRPHQSLAWKTPSQYRAEHLASRVALAA
jgi:transposase InsO family protein